jgi:hypothetical protein
MHNKHRPCHHSVTSLEEGLASLAARGEAALRCDDDMTWDRAGPPFTLDGVASRDLLNALREEPR